MTAKFIAIGTSRDHKEIEIEIPTFLRTRGLVQANSGGGKSYLLRLLAEKLFGKVQVIIIDSEGEFASLREKYDYALIGAGGEAAVDVRSAGLLAERLMELRVSAVCDLFESFRKTPQSRHTWVKNFCNGLLDLPRKHWHPMVLIIDEFHKFCLSADTELLTNEGWKRYEHIRVGDLCSNFDMVSGKYKWLPIKRVSIREYKGPMVRLNSDGIDSLSTLGHRVVISRIQRARGRYKIYPPSFCSGSEVPMFVYVPKGGAPTGIGIKELSLDFARILGWIITDGHFSGSSKSKNRFYLAITQAKSTVKCGTSIFATMRSILEKYGVSTYERDRGIRQILKNRKPSITSPSAEFYLGVSLTRALMKFLGTEIHRIPRKILSEASPEQLHHLFIGLMEGDGTSWNGKWVRFYAGNNEGVADDFQELALRLGISATKRFSNKQWTVNISGRHAHFVRKKKPALYSGVVWDITVPTGAFVARRNGKAFVTGNCPEKGAGESEASESVIGVGTAGRKRGICLIGATQRLGKVRKDVSAELLNRFVGPTFEDLDVRRAADLLSVPKEEQRTFFEEMRVLEPGNFYVFGRAVSKKRVLVKIGKVHTTHPEMGAKVDDTPPPTPKNIKALLPQLADLPQEAEKKAQTESDLRKEIRKLESDLRSAKHTVAPVDESKAMDRGAKVALKKIAPLVSLLEEAMDVIVKVNAFGFEKTGLTQEQIESAFQKAAKQVADLSLTQLQQRHAQFDVLKRETNRLLKRMQGMLSKESLNVNVKVMHNEPVTVAPAAQAEVESNGDISRKQMGILTALAEFKAIGRLQVPRKWIAARSGASHRSSAFANNLSALRTKGFLDYAGGLLILKSLGEEMVPSVEPPQSREDMMDSCLRILSRKQQDILRALGSNYPSEMSRDSLAEASGASVKSSAFANNLSALRSAGMIDYREKNVMLQPWVVLEDQ